MPCPQNMSHSIRFRYADIFFSYYSNDHVNFEKHITEHMLAHVYSGEMLVEENGLQTSVKGGQSIFLRRDHRVSITKKPLGGAQFQGMFMQFHREFLREFFQSVTKEDIPADIRRSNHSVHILPKSEILDSLFNSMTPYFDSFHKPPEAIMKLKLQEGVHALLNIDINLYSNLFDFSEPWKIDLLDFMEKNFCEDLSMEEFASYSGRSLATFKRDFKKVSPIPPQKWLIEKRLLKAHDLLRSGHRKISDVYLDVGFKSLSHFSTTYKKMFGSSPTKER